MFLLLTLNFFLVFLLLTLNKLMLAYLRKIFDVHAFFKTKLSFIPLSFILLSFLVQVRAISRGGSRTAATSKMEHFLIIVNGFQQLAIMTKSSILNVATVLDPSLISKRLDQIKPASISKT